MAQRNLRLKWASKLLRAKSFVVLTDKESIIALRGMDPQNLRDMMSLQQQAASIDDFIYQLQDLREEHTRVIETIMERTRREGKKVHANHRKKAAKE